MSKKMKGNLTYMRLWPAVPWEIYHTSAVQKKIIPRAKSTEIHVMHIIQPSHVLQGEIVQVLFKHIR